MPTQNDLSKHHGPLLKWVQIACCTIYFNETYCANLYKSRGVGLWCFSDIWIFAKFLIGLHQVLLIPLFSIWTAHILYYDNFKSVKVQGWTPHKILIFLHWTLRPTYTTLFRKQRAISHWMGVPKNRGKCKSATISLHCGDSLMSMSSVVW